MGKAEGETILGGQHDAVRIGQARLVVRASRGYFKVSRC
jgi:hypothetical protein